MLTNGKPAQWQKRQAGKGIKLKDVKEVIDEMNFNPECFDHLLIHLLSHG